MTPPAAPRIVHRTLAPEEVEKAIAAGGPLAELQVDPEKLKAMVIAVVEVDGVVVAYWVVWYALHTEPLWIAPQWRRHPAVVSGLVNEVQQIVEATQEGAAFAVIEDSDQADQVQRYATRLGFLDAPGKLYYLVVKDALPKAAGA